MSKCVSDMCKKDLKSLESDKAYIALKKKMETSLTTMKTFTLKPSSELTKKDLATVNMLHKQMTAHTKAKSDIEKFNQLRACQFEKCRDEIDAMIAAFSDACKEDPTTGPVSRKHCKLLSKKLEMDAKQVQRAQDEYFVRFWADWKKHQTNKIMGVRGGPPP